MEGKEVVLHQSSLSILFLLLSLCFFCSSSLFLSLPLSLTHTYTHIYTHKALYLFFFLFLHFASFYSFLFLSVTPFFFLPFLSHTYHSFFFSFSLSFFHTIFFFIPLFSLFLMTYSFSLSLPFHALSTSSISSAPLLLSHMYIASSFTSSFLSLSPHPHKLMFEYGPLIKSTTTVGCNTRLIFKQSTACLNSVFHLLGILRLKNPVFSTVYL